MFYRFSLRKLLILNVLAEREGFEPPIPFRVCLISSPTYIL